jgi:acyl-CoA thioesterase FadM
MTSATLEEPALAWGIAVFPWLRLIRVGIGLGAASRVDLLSTTRVSLRAWPSDLDLNFHVNNGRYLALADIGRIHWFVRTGVLGAARRRRAFPVVGDALARFRRDLKAFESFEIHTRLIGWNQKWGFLEHRFVRRDRVIGLIAVRGMFKGPAGPVDPGELLSELAHAAPSPELPAWANEFQQSCELLSGMLREEERMRGLRSTGR